MAVRSGSAVWNGDLKGGKGHLKVDSGAYDGPYSFSSRFEEGTGTNPEELIAAAHAGCFSMALANGLASAGFTVEKVETTAKVHLTAGVGIGPIELINRSRVPGISSAQFQEIAAATKIACPVSKALSAVEITLEAHLDSLEVAF